MIRQRIMVGLVTCLLIPTCSWTQRSSAQRTLIGINEQQALVAAHRVLTDQSFEVSAVDHETGTLTTEWRDRPSRSLRYVITVTAGESGGNDDLSAVDLEIRAEARNRAVRGWTDEYPVTSEADRTMRRISREAGAVNLSPAIMAPPTPAVPEEPEVRERQCTTSRECPPGQHCGTGRCVWECATDDECEGDSICDRRGRCIQPPPPAPTRPEPPPQPEEEE